ncbi:methyltransferase [Stigmatella aurantiaca]|uniref:Tetracenomycin polyketide synthesis 8-O-methyl transferase TcmO n=1 Tax=Stigmatella aurantiaca (strain DW4/3-1) TaxID=378806 RepID=Q09AX9_STIAD|nr:methyltransferase [Stigmatella aurantiaca]ADO72399.1 Tetracenomycin polyketide synthesis 8-O-methyl transferase TcmO [Stigmatella aurantiaca DW4/3-1]EAU68886.1 tetracenomycin polyketide synthesis 8-O-methyl transferase TcmO [Stigmatella aurantiaca DW4/3-1]
MTQAFDPSRIMQIGTGYWASKTLLTAVELGVFTQLGQGSLTGPELGKRMELHPRTIYDFFDSLVALGLLEREGDGPTGRYRNTPETKALLDRNSPDYMGGILEMFNSRLYRFWGDLSEALRTGEAQSEIKHTGKSMYTELFSDPERLEQFTRAMSGISRRNFVAFAEKFDLSRYRTLCDVGGSSAELSISVAQRHPHLACVSFDLPVLKPIAQRAIDRAGLTGRITPVGGDFLHEPLPKADVITMGMILHNWSLEKRKHLIRLAYEALPEDGAFVAIEHFIDDARRQNAFGLLMSLTMLIEFGDASDFTGADFRGWCSEAGFRRFETIALTDPGAAVVAYK